MGEGVLQTLRRSMYCTHDLNMLKLLYRRCAILTSSSNPPKWTLQLLWDCVFCVVGGFPFSSSPSLSFFVFVADRVPYQQQKQRKTQTWRGGKGKAAHNTKPKTTRKSVRHVQLDLSIHVLGTLPKIPYPDTKVFSLAAACGSTCFLNI
jgi:hypothetical protein